MMWGAIIFNVAMGILNLIIGIHAYENRKPRGILNLVAAGFLFGLALVVFLKEIIN